MPQTKKIKPTSDNTKQELVNLKTAMVAYGIAGVLFFVALINLGSVGSTRSFVVLAFGVGSFGALSFFSATQILGALVLAKLRNSVIVTKIFVISLMLFVGGLTGFFAAAVVAPGAQGSAITALLGMLTICGVVTLVSGIGMLYSVYRLCKLLEINVTMTVVSLAVPIVSVVACIVIYRKASKKLSGV